MAFSREDLIASCDGLGIKVPKNIGDIVYSFRYRAAMPLSIEATAPEGKTWVIKPAGPARYRFVLVQRISLEPSPHLAVTKIPDATPGVVARYALSDEQALLAKVRYNRLIDIFLGITCYSLQNHLRTTAPEVGQLETDELYIGLDKKGSHYVIPVQAKGGKDRLSIVQIEQDLAMCAHKFPLLLCRPVAVQFRSTDIVVMFEFEDTDEGVRVTSEKHYRLVDQDEITDEDIEQYRARLTS